MTLIWYVPTVRLVKMVKGEIVVRVGDRKPIGLFKEYYRDPNSPARLGTTVCITQVIWRGAMRTATTGSRVVSTM